MYDPELDSRFSMGDSAAVSDGRWWGGEPIWVTAEKSGLTAATFFWPGTEASIDGVRPTFWKPYSDGVPNDARVDQTLAWLDVPADQRPAFLTLYFSDVDGASHRHGPLSDETGAAIGRVDHQLARLIDGLRSRNIEDLVNLVIVSDHGMSQLSRDRVVFIDDFIDVQEAGILSLGEYVALWPDDALTDEIFDALEGSHEALTVYRKGEIPVRYHLDGHRRTPPIVGVVKKGWSVTTHRWFDQREGAFTGGGHGYDNNVPDMAGIFIAAGPAFQSGVSAGTLDAVDVYNLLAASLHIEPALNDGNSGVAQEILNRKVTQP
jgi:predicted AlkP superfamily pyrophosphatase or phosphodiesterase